MALEKQTDEALVELDLKDAIDLTLLPDNPYYGAVNDFLIRAYEETWNS